MRFFLCKKISFRFNAGETAAGVAHWAQYEDGDQCSLIHDPPADLLFIPTSSDFKVQTILWQGRFDSMFIFFFR